MTSNVLSEITCLLAAQNSTFYKQESLGGFFFGYLDLQTTEESGQCLSPMCEACCVQSMSYLASEIVLLCRPIPNKRTWHVP